MSHPPASPQLEGPDPAQAGPEEPRPSGNPEPLGAQGPDVVDKGEPDPVARVWTIQKPVYYVSEVLHEAKARYLEMHKLIYAILIASRKLHHYFQAHRVVVVTSYPLRAILADFIAEWTPSPSNSGGPDLNAGPLEPEVRTPVFTEPHWTLFFDGSVRKQWAV